MRALPSCLRQWVSSLNITFIHLPTKQGGEHVRKKLGQFTAEQVMEVLEQLPTTESEKNDDFKLELITILKQFCDRKGLHEQVEATIPDRRNQELTIYSKQSLMMSALMIFLLRMSSGNRFDTKSHDNDDKYSRTNVAKFIDAPENCVPVIKTIEKFGSSEELGAGPCREVDS